MKLIRNKIKTLLVQLQGKGRSVYSKIIIILVVSFICWIFISGIFTSLPSYSLAKPLNNNTCEQANECIVISQTPESNDFNPEKTDLKNIIEHQIKFIKDLRKIYGKNSLSRLAIILFMTIGPIKIIPVFVRLTQNASEKIRIKLAIRSFGLSTRLFLQ